ncbi:MAG: c-type cytochrome [Pseudomonadota bacterium]
MKSTSLSLVLIALAVSACGQKTPAADVAAPVAAVATAPAPAAVAAAAPMAPVSAADLAIGEKVYGATCLSCHGAAVLGAPKFADKAAWGPRIAKGKDVLYASALNGFKMMPAKGGNAALKDDELKAAVDYMVSKAL